jgi:hypothetical protein
MSASRTPCGANDRYVTAQNPPNDCPSTVHGSSGPHRLRRISSQSKTMESARKRARYSAWVAGVPSRARDRAVSGADRPVPRWSSSSTR